jgi:hypothetical protein
VGPLPRGLRRGGLWPALLLLLGLVVPPGAAAQETQPPDTIPPADTLTAAVPPEAGSPAGMAPWIRPTSEGFGLAVWNFDAELLGRFQGLSLLELLELLPGVDLVRSGGFGRPTGLHAMGAGGGRLRVFRDGVELDPLESATLDLQRLGLAELEALRVERGLSGIRLDLYTLRLRDERPFSQIEAATGDFQTRYLRAIFTRAVSSRDVLLLHFEVTDTDGYGWNQPYSFNALGGRWARTLTGWLDAEVQLRRTFYERGNGAVEGARLDETHLRLRGRPADGVALEAYYATAHRESGAADPFVEPLRSAQLGVRGALATRLGSTEVSIRGRPAMHGYHLPATDLELRADLAPYHRLQTLTELRFAGGHLEGEARVATSLPAGFGLFGGVTAGRRAVGLLGDTVFEVIRVVDGDTLVADTILPTFPWETAALRGVRAGGGWSVRGWGIEAAALHLAPGSTAPFGLAFDRGMEPEEVGAARGLEARARIPLPLHGAWLQADWIGWAETGGRAHLPHDSWRVAFHFHRLFYEGNLEPTLRLDAVRRGAARVPLPDGGEGVSSAAVIYNAYLQIRVLDVRAYVSWQNIFHDRRGADLPGVPLPGQRAVYGVRWHFFD